MRYWSAEIIGNTSQGQDFAFAVQPDLSDKSLRIQFEISATIDTRYYNGSIRIFN